MRNWLVQKFHYQSLIWFTEPHPRSAPREKRHRAGSGKEEAALLRLLGNKGQRQQGPDPALQRKTIPSFWEGSCTEARTKSKDSFSGPSSLRCRMNALGHSPNLLRGCLADSLAFPDLPAGLREVFCPRPKPRPFLPDCL